MLNSLSSGGVDRSLCVLKTPKAVESNQELNTNKVNGLKDSSAALKSELFNVGEGTKKTLVDGINSVLEVCIETDPLISGMFFVKEYTLFI